MISSKLRDIALLVLVVLIVYYPAITDIVNTVDDGHIINAYSSPGRTLKEILLPGAQFYFRPLIELTYYFDNTLWGLEPRMMHLENVILHLLNVILVYLVAMRVSLQLNGLPYLPLVSAMLFAVHPVNTEAVSWIAGRTDPLAAFFILISVLYLMRFIGVGLIRHFVVSFVAMILAILAKEISIMLLPISLIFIHLSQQMPQVNSSFGRKRQIAITAYIFFCVVLVIYAAVRIYMKPGSSQNAFTVMFQGQFSPKTMLSDILTTIGFYVRKFFVPVPLNFAIDGVSAWYIVPGVAAVAYSVLILTRKTVLALFIVAGLFFLFPAVVVRMAALNWTPVAERYLYIPTAFASIGVSGMVIRQASKFKHKAFFFVIIIVVPLLFAGITLARNITWRDNLSLYQDAVAKSPNFGDIHNELGIALLKNGDCQQAKKHFAFAMQRSTRPLIRELAELNMLNCEMEGMSLAAKKLVVQHYIDSHASVQPKLVIFLKDLLYEMYRVESDAQVRVKLLKEIIPLNNKIYQINKDAHCLYRNGQHWLLLGERQTALECFRKTLASASGDEFYYAAAKKLVRKLEQE